MNRNTSIKTSPRRLQLIIAVFVLIAVIILGELKII